MAHITPFFMLISLSYIFHLNWKTGSNFTPPPVILMKLLRWILPFAMSSH